MCTVIRNYIIQNFYFNFGILFLMNNKKKQYNTIDRINLHLPFVFWERMIFMLKCPKNSKLLLKKTVLWFKSYSVYGQIRPLQSNPLISSISSGVKLKSQISKFSLILDLVTDFGIVICPLCTWYFKTTCAAVFLYFCANCLIFGSSRSWGSPGFAHGLSGEPKGL